MDHTVEARDTAALSATPMMAQYHEIKAANPDCLLFYRMGDFYEMFFADAEVASRALGITLTKRGKHQGADIPMCGVPIHAADQYLQKLIAQGFRVAVRNNYLAAVARQRGGNDGADVFALAWIDISTAEFRIAGTDKSRLTTDL